MYIKETVAFFFRKLHKDHHEDIWQVMGIEANRFMRGRAMEREVQKVINNHDIRATTSDDPSPCTHLEVKRKPIKHLVDNTSI